MVKHADFEKAKTLRQSYFRFVRWCIAKRVLWVCERTLTSMQPIVLSPFSSTWKTSNVSARRCYKCERQWPAVTPQYSKCPICSVPTTFITGLTGMTLDEADDEVMKHSDRLRFQEEVDEEFVHIVEFNFTSKERYRLETEAEQLDKKGKGSV